MTSPALPSPGPIDPSSGLSYQVAKRFAVVNSVARKAMDHSGNGQAGAHIGGFLRSLAIAPNVAATTRWKFASAIRGTAAEGWAQACRSGRLSPEQGQAIADLCWAWGDAARLSVKNDFHSGKDSYQMSEPWAAAYAMDAADPRTGGRVLTPLEYTYVLLAAVYQVGPAQSSVQVPTVWEPATGRHEIPAANDTLVQQVRWWRMRGCSYQGKSLVECVHDRLVAQEGGVAYAQMASRQHARQARQDKTKSFWSSLLTLGLKRSERDQA